MSKSDGRSIVKSSRAERAARDSRDISNPDHFPQIVRDHPAVIGPKGIPQPVWQTRIQSYGEHGFYHETKCQHCGKWLSYQMCKGCQAMLRLTGQIDRKCRCRLDSLVIFLNCEDHRKWEDPV